MHRVHYYMYDNGTYDVHRLWILTKTLPVVEMLVEDLAFNLDETDWQNSSVYSRPRDVLELPLEHPNEFAKIMRSDLSYPILILDNNDIVDGLHRLCKCLHQQILSIRVRIVPPEIMQLALVYEDESVRRISF